MRIVDVKGAVFAPLNGELCKSRLKIRQVIQPRIVIQANQPAGFLPWQADFTVLCRAMSDPLERAVAGDLYHTFTTAQQDAFIVATHVIKIALRQPGVRKIRLPFMNTKQNDRQTAILLYARQRATSSPVGRPPEATVQAFTRMIDPDLRLRRLANPQMNRGFLITPFPQRYPAREPIATSRIL